MGNILCCTTKSKNFNSTLSLEREIIVDAPVMDDAKIADALVSDEEIKQAQAPLDEEQTVDAPQDEEKVADASPGEENGEAKIVDASVDGGKSVDNNSLDVASVDAKVKVFIIFYSAYGHVLAMAKKMKEGVDSVEGVEGFLYQVPETLPENVLSMMKAPPKDESIPTITAAQLSEADGFLFGFPTRFGVMAAQMKAFFDSTGALWKTQALAGKPAGLFVSTGSQGGGQETTALTSITQLVHHGMLYVPIGYTFGSGMFTFDEIRGGSPYGAGTYAGNGSRKPSELELAMAKHQGQYTANFAKMMAKNKDK
ncbi:hypothetical protein KC19_6G121500 [Ceratodon purpureus]|uniref:NAD(P)H dehydrogenase (quinone) n=1 Tax=Ceratodon purpureus TaxID=3225 RepID=A0A8T0HDM1_CERPU|nr:hypothetical protein KC19_6G121500 [Ceratodon purpureus]